MKGGALAVAALLTAALAAHADVRDSVNWARSQGCRARGMRAALRDNPQLVQAAGRLAAGQSLQAALAAAGYPATQSSAVHVSGATADAELSQLLVANDCAALTDPAFQDLGAQRHGRDVWLILAAPAAVPSTRDAAAVARQILGLVNEARASGRRCGSKVYGAASPLALDATLNRAALAHAEDMARYAEFEHRGHDGSTPAARIARAGYGEYAVVGENIAAGAMTPLEVTQGWLASPAHCENIMDPRFSQIGIAFAVNRSSNELVYWTQDFAAPSPRSRTRSRAAVNP